MMLNNIRGAVIGTALLAAALPLSAGTADAIADLELHTTSVTVDNYSCEMVGVSCRVWASSQSDWTTPVTISADGTVLGTSAPGSCCSTDWYVWTPTTTGHHVLTARQGTRTATLGVDILDPNSLQGILHRLLPGSA